MISVQNHLQPLSGNKFSLLMLMGLCLAACSPKVQPIKKEVPAEVKTVEEKKAPKKFTEAAITLLVPFNLDDYRSKVQTKAEIEKHAMAIDFYQGFRLGLDSASTSGLNFKLNVYDTQDSNEQLQKLIRSQLMDDAHLLIGPVFPQGIKYLTPYSIAHHIPMVSPLAASRPEDFNNPNLISIVNNIDLHGLKIGNYIAKRYQPAQTEVVLISTKSPSDELLAQPLRSYFLNQTASKLPFTEYASVFTLETRMQKGKKYVVMVTSSDQKFVAATIDKLVKMQKAGFSIDLYGHPDWLKQNYTTEKLQTLNTIISSSYQVDFNSPTVISFIRKYRKTFNFEPGEFAYKGFDIGLYFGRQFSLHGADFAKHLTKEKYKGLHNSFIFQHDEKTGFVNTNLMLLRYRGFALNIVE